MEDSSAILVAARQLAREAHDRRKAWPPARPASRSVSVASPPLGEAPEHPHGEPDADSSPAA